MPICKHIKAKHCGTSGPTTHDFPCSTVDGLLPTSSSIGDKFYIPGVNYNVWGCDGYVITGVYACGVLSNTSPSNCSATVDLTTCGLDANGNPLWVPGVTSPSLFGIDCQDCYDKVCPPIPGCTDPTANNYNSLATFDDGSCTYGPIISASHCYCCYNNNVVGVIQQVPAGQSCSVLNGANGYSNCNQNHLFVVCKPEVKPKHCYCCDGTSAIGINQAANPLPFGMDCSYYNTLTSYGWYDCGDDYTTINCDGYANDCTCCDNGSSLSMGPAPVGANCNWFNSLGYTLCDLTTNFNQALCEPDPNEHCACCKNGQMTMVGLPLPIGQTCDYWSGMYGWNNCTGATYFNIDECEDCGCTEMLGTGRTGTFDWNQEDNCLEGCCDPDLKRCDVLVIGDDEGVQVYSTTGNNTTHLFDVPSHDIKDIASNGNFIWVYRTTGLGTQIDEYTLVMAPFTVIPVRTITIAGMDIGNGLTYYGIHPNGSVLLTSVNDKTRLLELPAGTTNISVTVTTANGFPGFTPAGVATGYKCTGDILTRGVGNSSTSVNNSLDAILYDNGTIYKVAKVQRLTGLVLEEHTIDPTLMTGTTRFHSLYTDTTNNRLAGITTDGRIYELMQSPVLEFGQTIIGHVDFYNTGSTVGGVTAHTVYGASNVDWSDGTCAGKILAYPKTYNCTINGCVDPLNGTGQYIGATALADCNTLCIITWNCNPGTGYHNCTNAVTYLPYTINLVVTIPYIQSGPAAITHISTAGAGVQYDDFNTMYFYWNGQPIIPGQCTKWSQSGGVGKWKITEISHPQITTTIPIQSWAVFIQTLQANGLMGMVNMSMNYAQIETICYSHFGAQYQIDVTYEPCICTPIPCTCTPLIGTTGTFTSSATCITSCCPAPPCTVCCQSNTSNYPQPGYSWMSTSPTTPCYCPSNSTQIPCITCNKCCTNGTLQVMLGANDQNCDCSFYGLYSCYLPPCKKCCYNKHTGTVSPAQLPDCNCKSGEWKVPCHSLPHKGIACLAPTQVVPTTPTTTATTPTTLNPVLVAPVDVTTGTQITIGTNANVTSLTKIYVIYDDSSLTIPYITSIQNSVSDWLISNGLTTNNVETIEVGNERWVHWPSMLYNGLFTTPNVGTPTYSDDVLIIAFIDESDHGYHGGDTQSSPDVITSTGNWIADYLSFKLIHTQITGNFNAVLYATSVSNNTHMTRRAFSMQSFQAVSSGNNLPLDGKWQIGKAPRPASDGGTVGGVPELCSNANLEKLEISNPYWNGTTPTYGGLDQFGWKINIRFEPVTSAMLTYDLNTVLPPTPPPPPVNPNTPSDIKGILVVDSPQLPSTYSSSAAAAAFWLCADIPAPNGYGNGCYGFDVSGFWTNPYNGTVMQASGCLAWHLGGNCYAAQHTSDFPITVNTNNGPVTVYAPPEKACSPNCLAS